MFTRVSSLAAIVFPIVSAPLAAQDTTIHVPNEFERRSSGAFTVIQSRPTGTLGDNIGLGYGINGTYLFRLDQRGVFSLRTDVSFLQYGTESKHVPLSSTVGGRIQVKVSTTNNIVPLAIGPQLTWPTGSVRPYVNGGIGGQFFYTQSGVEGEDSSYEFANTTNQWDKTMTWVAGGGVYVPVYERKVKVMLDIGAQYLKGGRARYLKPGSIEDLPGGDIRITPMESETHMVLVRFGAKIGL